MNLAGADVILRNSILLGTGIVLFAVLSVRLAKRDRNISGKRALALASIPILIQIARESVGFSELLGFRPLDLLLLVFVAVALGYSLVALVRCPTRTYAAIAVVFAFTEVLLIPTVMVPLLGEIFSGMG